MISTGFYKVSGSRESLKGFKKQGDSFLAIGNYDKKWAIFNGISRQFSQKMLALLYYWEYN